jgi:hypothetical protein
VETYYIYIYIYISISTTYYYYYYFTVTLINLVEAAGGVSGLSKKNRRMPLRVPSRFHWKTTLSGRTKGLYTWTSTGGF